LAGNVVNYASGGAALAGATLTITGTDINGAPLTESITSILTSGTGAFTFTSVNKYKAGTAYTVAVGTQPSGSKTCEVMNGTGTIPSGADSVASVNNLFVTCRLTSAASMKAYVATSNTAVAAPANGTVVPFGAGTGATAPTGTQLFDATTGAPPAAGTAVSTNATFLNPLQVVVHPYSNGVGWVVEGGGTLGATTVLPHIRTMLINATSFNPSFSAAAPTVTTATCAAAGTSCYVAGATAFAANPLDGMSAYVLSNTGATVQGSVTGFEVGNGTTGTLTLSTVAATVVGINPKAIIFHPSNKYFYVVNAGNGTTAGTVGAYTPSGGMGARSLAALNTLNATTNTVAAGLTASAIAIDNTGNYAYVANKGDGTVSMYKICQLTRLANASPCTAGTLSSLGTVLVGGASNSVPDRITADKGSVYVVSSQTGNVYQYTIGVDGTLTAAGSATPGTGTVGVLAVPTLSSGTTSNYLYAINSSNLMYSGLLSSPLSTVTSVTTGKTTGVAFGMFR